MSVSNLLQSKTSASDIICRSIDTTAILAETIGCNDLAADNIVVDNIVINTLETNTLTVGDGTNNAQDLINFNIGEDAKFEFVKDVLGLPNNNFVIYSVDDPTVGGGIASWSKQANPAFIGAINSDAAGQTQMAHVSVPNGISNPIGSQILVDTFVPAASGLQRLYGANDFTTFGAYEDMTFDNITASCLTRFMQVESGLELEGVIADLKVNKIADRGAGEIIISEDTKCIIASSVTSTIPDANSLDCTILASSETNVINSTDPAEVANAIIATSNGTITSGSRSLIAASSSGTINVGIAALDNAIISSSGANITGGNRNTCLSSANPSISTVNHDCSIISSSSSTINCPASGINNSIIGTESCSITNGERGVIIGSQSCIISTPGVSNAIIGSSNVSTISAQSRNAIIGSNGATITGNSDNVILGGNATTTSSGGNCIVGGIGTSTVNAGCLVLGDATAKTCPASTTQEATLCYTNGTRIVADATHGLKFGLLSGGVLDFTNQSFLSAYEELNNDSTSFSSAAWAVTPQSFNLTYRRIGKLCTIFLPVISAANANGAGAAATITSAAIPTRFRPSSSANTFSLAIDNGVTTFTALVSIASTGVITIYKDAATLGTFTNIGGGSNGLPISVQLTYVL